ncbi:leukocyte cell-derived chemotaxin 1-like [Myxocyprinus asiaticus]|uniref:leukocyte cell-derived chemotaxin 1-like n=1 Tax=Myxocyprinus asiaticus TaxID=70543 RepID=UPI002221E7F3|nr:leukocyte cell-derived chemotaxin 1-like [Myxocyprinus asiaticus]
MLKTVQKLQKIQKHFCEKTDNTTMEETSEKVPLEAYSDIMCVKPRGYNRLKRTAIAAFIAGAVLLLFGGIGAFYLWKATEKEVISAYYSKNINIKMIEDDSLEVNSENNQKTMEVRDFKAGITAVKFPGGEKCYIMSQVRSKLSEEKDIMTVKPDVDSLVPSEEPLKDQSFLSPEILRFCGDLPVYWQYPATPRALRKRRHVTRVRRQSEGESNQRQSRRKNTAKLVKEEEDVPTESSGPAYNPENPYHQSQGGEESMTFDPMLDHRGICCTECQRSHTHCQRVCEPLGGTWQYPYNFHGCRVVCRIIMPCRWWAARTLGLV